MQIDKIWFYLIIVAVAALSAVLGAFVVEVINIQMVALALVVVGSMILGIAIFLCISGVMVSVKMSPQEPAIIRAMVSVISVALITTLLFLFDYILTACKSVL